MRLELIVEDAGMHACIHQLYYTISSSRSSEGIGIYRSRGEECGVEESSVVMPDDWDLETPTELRHIFPSPPSRPKESWF